MRQEASGPPFQRGGVLLCENSAGSQNTNDRVLAANHDVQQLLEQVNKFINELTADLMRNPFGADWRKKFTELKQETIEIRKEVHAIRIATTIPARNQTGPSEQVFSYVEALKRGTTAPAHFLSAHGSTSTQAASPSELSKDQLGDQEIAEKPTMLAAGATAGPDPVLAAIQFVAARQLKSGDLSVRLRSTRDVEAARIHRHEWIRHLWKGAEVRLPSYGVVIHDAT
ncbi:hypothetical protein N7485_013337, partial [Penicillium canescens]